MKNHIIALSLAPFTQIGIFLKYLKYGNMKTHLSKTAKNQAILTESNLLNQRNYSFYPWFFLAGRSKS